MMTVNRVIGIDPGIHGAIASINMDGEVLGCVRFPLVAKEKPNQRKPTKKQLEKGTWPKTRTENNYNMEKMAELFTIVGGGPGVVAYVELVHSMQGEGSASSFKFGKCYGTILGMLAMLGLPVRDTTPKEWCSAMHIPGDKEKNAKVRSRSAFEYYFESHIAKTGKRFTDGEIDALLIAEFGRRRLIEGMDLWGMTDDPKLS